MVPWCNVKNIWIISAVRYFIPPIKLVTCHKQKTSNFSITLTNPNIVLSPRNRCDMWHMDTRLPSCSILLLVAWFSCPFSWPCLFCQHVESAAVMYRGEHKWPGGAFRETGGVLLTLQQWVVVPAHNHVLRVHRRGLPAPTHRKG